MEDQQASLMAQGLREGKVEAWQALYDAYSERVWRGIARLLGPQSTDVADVVQETMLAAARSAASFDPARGSLWQWLWGIAHNHVALHWRKQTRRQKIFEAGDLANTGNGRWLESLASKETSPSETLASAELTQQVRAALAALPADYCLLLTARYLDGEAVERIAEREQSSQVAVRSRLARARQAFRQAFGMKA
jgi:RNA polymerase sigma-70 factor (ECF subfamily)